MYTAVIFIQKFWRGYQVRKNLYLAKMQEMMKKNKIKKGMKSFVETLTIVNFRIQDIDIVNIGF